MDAKAWLAIPVLIVKLPLLALKYLATHRILLVVAVLVIGSIFAYSRFTGNDKTQVEIPKYQQIIPDISKAPRIVQTASRYYPYSTALENSEFITLTDYYFYDSNKWQHSTAPLPLDKKDIIKIYTRVTGG